MTRADQYRRLHSHGGHWDLIVIGGGATGVGIAIDAAARGYSVLLLERHDFGKGTSSRSTKLVHGGVRYLEQGNLSLVMEALKERGLLLQNAPHLVRNLGFVVPTYDWWESPFYGIGLKLYNLLAGKYGFGASRILSKEETLERLPTINPEGLRGGVIYFDGQFDDARLLIDLVTTAWQQGATLLNYSPVTAIVKDADGFVDGVRFRDLETGEEHEALAKAVINATGPFADGLRTLADSTVEPMIAPSQGIHLVFDSSFLPGDSAIMVPHTSDGRVMFAIPWHGHTLVGTTDTPVAEVAAEPVAQEQEIEFILQHRVALSRQETHARRYSQHVRRHPPAGEIGRRRQHRGAFARARHPHREFRHDHRLRRQMDHLPSHGRRLREPGRDSGALARPALRHREPCDLRPRRVAAIRTAAPRPALYRWRCAPRRTRRNGAHLGRRARPQDARAFSQRPRGDGNGGAVAELMAHELGRDAAWAREQVESFRRIAASYLPH